MSIVTVKLTNQYPIVIVRGRNVLHLSRDGAIIMNGNYYFDANHRTRYTNHKMIKYTNLTEKDAIGILRAAKIDTYINYIGEGTVDTALESITTFLINNGVSDNEFNRLYIIIPKYSKTLIGTKIMVEFELVNTDFSGANQTVELPVYMTKMKSDTKRVVFSVEIPEYILEKCRESEDDSHHPATNYIESETFSDLHTQMKSWCVVAHNVVEAVKQATNTKKVILLYFKGTNSPHQDAFNHAYGGQDLRINFRYVVVDRIGTQSAYNNRPYRTNLRVGKSSSLNSAKSGIEINIPNVFITNMYNVFDTNVLSGGVEIEWTQEREDFLKKLQSNFEEMISKLNGFLGNMDGNKMDKLIENQMSLLLK